MNANRLLANALFPKFIHYSHDILPDLTEVANHIGDVVVYGKTLEEHNAKLHAVLRQEKCNFESPVFDFLDGHIIDGNGIII